MPKGDKIMSSIEMRSLIFEALSIEDEANSPRKQTFKMYGYKGCDTDLRAIVEYLAIKYSLTDEVCEIHPSAWGVPGEKPAYKRNSNFSEDELNLFTEEVHLLIFQNVLSPGAIGNYGDNYPYFHVTKYGKACLDDKNILPYDPEKYLAKLKSIATIDDWELFYIEQALVCYNAGAMEAAIIMIGLAGELLANRLIDSMISFIDNNIPTLKQMFEAALSGKRLTSQRYIEYENILQNVLASTYVGQSWYASLNSLRPKLDGPAKKIYSTYLRLTRNELAHPSDTKMARIECLTLFSIFIEYCSTQHEYINVYISNS